MTGVSTFNPLLRAVLVVGAVAALVTGATFAALQSSTASLTGNTLSSATADLDVSTNGTTFGATRAGFDFDNIVPGGDAAPEEGHAFWLRNDGSADLALTATVEVLPTTVPGDLDLSKVHLIVTDPGTDGTLDGVDDVEELNASITELNAGDVPLLSDLLPNAPDGKKYFVQATMDADTFDGEEGTVDSFDLTFKGTNAEEATD